MTDCGPNRASTLRDYLKVVRRRKLIITQAIVLVPVAAVAFSLRQTPLYQASGEVLISHQNLATSLTNTQDPTLYQQADRITQTQADLARVPRVGEEVRKALRLTDRTAADILAATSVSVKQNADLLVFTARDRSRDLAARIAAEYARQFTIYRRKLDTAALERARREVAEQAGALRGARDTKSPLYTSLVTKEQQLRTMEALQTSNSFVVRTPHHAVQVRPQPVRNGILGLALGLLLAAGLALLREALDTKVRTAQEIGDRLALPLLARLPTPPRRVRTADSLVMVEDPNGVHAEAFRMLRTNLEFANLERDARLVMVTSAVEAEGKSTTAANLALAIARTGKRVALVDLDLRRPYVARLFRLEDKPGLTDVALGRIELEQALAPVAVTEAGAKPTGENGNGHAARNGKANGNGKENGNGKTAAHGMLEVLTAGPVPPDVGEFVGSKTLAGILAKLRKRADVVLIDAPPLLRVGDAMTLSAAVDAMLVITRLNVVRRPVLNELGRVLDACPTPVLGYVAADVEADDEYGSGYAGDYYRRTAEASPSPSRADPTRPEEPVG